MIFAQEILPREEAKNAEFFKGLSWRHSPLCGESFLV
jgi:hypothetical protein